MKKYMVILSMVSALTLGACGGSAEQQTTAVLTDASGVQFVSGKGSISEERTTAFKSFMPDFSSMRKMANGDDAFDADKFKEKAAAFVEAARVPFDYFQNDPDGNGKALPAVWLQQEAFHAKRDAFFQAVDSLNAAAQNGKLEDIKAAVNAVEVSCQACHEAFRIND